MGKYYLGFDAGTQSVKVAVYNEMMECVSQFSTPTTLVYPQAGWVEMDVEEYLQAAVKSIKLCTDDMKNKGLNPEEIRCIFGDGVIEGIAGVDENCKAITPYINYLDSRTKEDASNLAGLGLDIWAKETGNPEPKCMFPAMFARWILKNSEEFRTRGCKFLHNAPYILSNLAGLKAEETCIDWGTLSGWGLGYRIMDKKWSDEQLEILKIDKKYLPKIVKPWDIIGHLTKEYADKTGLKEGTPICAGGGDTMQSMIGCGVTKAGTAADVAGTCAMFCIATNGIVPELSKPENNLIFNSGTLENTYFYWGFIRTGGLALRWFRDNICGRVGEGKYFDKLNEKAKEVKPGANGVTFIPYLTGGFNELKDASGAFLNLTMDTEQGVLWRAVLEAIGYDYMGITDICKKAGMDLEQITITEGGSRSEVWNQIKADMENRKMVTLQTAQGAVMTNAATAAFAVGDINDLQKAFEDSLVVKKFMSLIKTM
ncbi:Xylulose kinase [Lachnospiraceae bacterium TWA4]|nr:Xylulose kinase [Lachnospiraceae bacterium TWA4]